MCAKTHPGEATPVFPGLHLRLNSKFQVIESEGADAQRVAAGTQLPDVAKHLHDKAPFTLEIGGHAWYATMHEIPGGFELWALDFAGPSQQMARLRQGESMMRDTEGMTHLGTWYWDITQPHANWSPELYAMYGLDPATHTPTYEDYLTRVHPDDVERVKAATEAVFKDHKPYSHDERIRRPDGSWRYLHTWARAELDDAGNTKALIGVCQDITERKLAEIQRQELAEELRLAQRVAGLGSWTWHTREDEVTWSDEMYDVWGQDPRHEPLGFSAQLRLLTPESANRLERAVAQTLAQGTSYSLDLQMRSSDGPARWILAQGQAIHEQGRIVGLRGVAQDITERKRQEEKLRLAMEAARSGERAKTLFLAVMSHELRTPLNGVLGMAELLAGTPLTPEQQEMIVTMQASGDHLLELINNVLSYTKIQSGGLVVERSPVHLKHLADETMAMVAPMAGMNGLETRCVVDKALPEYVSMDPVHVREILLNLLGNAIKFTPTGSVHLRVKEAPGPGHVTFEVQDTGIGISPQHQEHLFAPFTQADDGYARHYEGSGLGLAISKGIAEGMGGTLTVESAVGKGSTFRLILPATKVEPKLKAVPVPYDATTHAHLRVLVAEDSTMNRQVILKMLERLGIRADVAVDGQAAVDRVERRDYDVVLMDVHMPRLDGFAAARIIRDRHPGRPRIIAVTADAMPEDRDRCLAAGMDDYLSKPVRLKALADALGVPGKIVA